MGDSNNNDDKLLKWLTSLDANALKLWQEVFTETRRLHEDIWSGLRYFLTANGILFAATVSVSAGNPTSSKNLSILLLCSAGLGLSILATRILYYQRKNYLRVRHAKTRLEYKLGFFDKDFEQSGIAFPLIFPRDVDSVLSQSAEAWVMSQMWQKGSISRALRSVYVICAVFYALVFVATLLSVVGLLESRLPFEDFFLFAFHK